MLVWKDQKENENEAEDGTFFKKNACCKDVHNSNKAK